MKSSAFIKNDMDDVGDQPVSPLVVTLRMDPASSAHFTAIRQAHFPSHRNWLDAHITLFHALPGSALEKAVADVADVAMATPAFSLQVDRILFLGAGVAFAVGSDQAEELRRVLARRWDGLLTRQDRSWRGPLHITVQNKVASATARALQDQLRESFVPRDVLATGVDIWHYEGGPWRLATTVLFP